MEEKNGSGVDGWRDQAKAEDVVEVDRVLERHSVAIILIMIFVLHISLRDCLLHTLATWGVRVAICTYIRPPYFMRQ
jgi:hypothetical protein